MEQEPVRSVVEPGEEITTEQFVKEFLGGGISEEGRIRVADKLRAIQESERRAGLLINSGLIQIS